MEGKETFDKVMVFVDCENFVSFEGESLVFFVSLDFVILGWDTFVSIFGCDLKEAGKRFCLGEDKGTVFAFSSTGCSDLADFFDFFNPFQPDLSSAARSQRF